MSFPLFSYSVKDCFEKIIAEIQNIFACKVYLPTDDCLFIVQSYIEERRNTLYKQ